MYIDEGLSNIQDTSMATFGKDSDGKNGVRCMQISPDGQILATGDRSGNLRYGTKTKKKKKTRNFLIVFLKFEKQIYPLCFISYYLREIVGHDKH